MERAEIEELAKQPGAAKASKALAPTPTALATAPALAKAEHSPGGRKAETEAVSQPSDSSAGPKVSAATKTTAPRLQPVPNPPQRLDLPDGAGGAWRCATLLSVSAREPSAKGEASVEEEAQSLDEDGRGEDAEMLRQCGRAGLSKQKPVRLRRAEG